MVCSVLHAKLQMHARWSGETSRRVGRAGRKVDDAIALCKVSKTIIQQVFFNFYKSDFNRGSAAQRLS